VSVPDLGKVGVELVASVGTHGENVVVHLGLTGCLSDQLPQASAGSLHGTNLGGCLDTDTGEAAEAWTRRERSLGWYDVALEKLWASIRKEAPASPEECLSTLHVLELDIPGSILPCSAAH